MNMKMKVNLLGLFQHVAGSIPKRDGRDHAEFCLQEVYGHINDVIQGKHTLAEFAEHYCLPPPPEVTPGHGTKGGPTVAEPDRPYCKHDQSCCDFTCGN